MTEGPKLVDRLAEAATVRRAFGDPIERDGSLVIPVARILGGDRNRSAVTVGLMVDAG